MKRIILIMLLILPLTEIYSEVPKIKIKLNDGSEKSYNLEDINNIFLTKNSDDSLVVFYSKTKSDNFKIKTLDSVKFKTSDNKLYELTFYLNEGSQQVKSYQLIDVDSIIFSQSTDLPSIKIGNQIWSLKNLDVSHYRNGDLVYHCKDSSEWVNLTTGGWCYYNNDSSNNATYGKLYNWYALNDIRGIAPAGWHVAADSEWTELVDFVGGEINGGGKLKEIGTTHWTAPNTGATNETGFTALPGGYRNMSFGRIGDASAFWSSTEVDNINGWTRYIFYFKTNVSRVPNTKSTGFSVRCVKD